ncbi:extensin-like domain-containing protein [Bosea sp. PAMC 26642]|uniref:extensin-like domain-containing protein n=1 Tax=Bosea sp. (strain PAMC 26642) TaxID=1792307 RepID=UPI0007706462|nr:extensin family protein [Bosea sp. PAMC 26642]AMJ61642.1 hypothetical protein AXW83_16185 [Bosea sp. PAMC 26642]
MLLLLAASASAARERSDRIGTAAKSPPATIMAPLPPVRPAELKPVAGPEADDGPSSAENGPTAPSACMKTFAERGGIALPLTADHGTGECRVEEPVTFRQIDMPDGSRVEMDSAITVRCAFALDILAWVRDDLPAIAARENGRIGKLVGVGGYACRPRNRVAGAQMSEHAVGNALDLGTLRLQDGRTIALTGGDAASRASREALRKSVCDRFTTVLGPGSDASHKDHLHLDMRQRPRGYRICQWTLD